MANTIMVGSDLTVHFVFEDVDEEGETTPIDLSGVTESVKVWRPDRSEVEGLTLEVDSAAAGTAHVDIPGESLDAPGTWKAQGFADGYKSAPVTWKVWSNPP